MTIGILLGVLVALALFLGKEVYSKNSIAILVFSSLSAAVPALIVGQDYEQVYSFVFLLIAIILYLLFMPTKLRLHITKTQASVGIMIGSIYYLFNHSQVTGIHLFVVATMIYILRDLYTRHPEQRAVISAIIGTVIYSSIIIISVFSEIRSNVIEYGNNIAFHEQILAGFVLFAPLLIILGATLYLVFERYKTADSQDVTNKMADEFKVFIDSLKEDYHKHTSHKRSSIILFLSILAMLLGLVAGLESFALYLGIVSLVHISESIEKPNWHTT
jgi:hypothetical protein